MERLNKVKWCLIGCVIVVLVLLVGSVFVPGGLTNAVRWVANGDPVYKLRGLSGQKPEPGKALVEMVVETVGVSSIDYQPVAILKEKDGGLYLPISIGLAEATAIAVVLENAEVPRPLTPDLLCAIVEKMGATVEQIVINDLRNHTFFASITLKVNWTQIEIDARPSDAIAVALRAKVPIYVEKAVLDKAGIQREDKTEKYTGTM